MLTLTKLRLKQVFYRLSIGIIAVLLLQSVIALGQQQQPRASVQGRNFAIQFGITSDRTEAEAKLKKAQAQKLDAYLVKSNQLSIGLLYSIRVGNYASRVAAEKAAQQFKASGAFGEYVVVAYEKPEAAVASTPVMSGNTASTPAASSQATAQPQLSSEELNTTGLAYKTIYDNLFYGRFDQVLAEDRYSVYFAAIYPRFLKEYGEKYEDFLQPPTKTVPHFEVWNRDIIQTDYTIEKRFETSLRAYLKKDAIGGMILVQIKNDIAKLVSRHNGDSPALLQFRENLYRYANDLPSIQQQSRLAANLTTPTASATPITSDAQNTTCPVTSRIEESFRLMDSVSTRIPIKRGDRLVFSASGHIKLGIFAGSGDPNGIAGYAQYNLRGAENIRHGTLVARIKQGNEIAGWFHVGTSMQVRAEVNGILELAVNDNATDDNSGEFIVKVVICKGSNTSNSATTTTSPIPSPNGVASQVAANASGASTSPPTTATDETGMLSSQELIKPWIYSLNTPPDERTPSNLRRWGKETPLDIDGQALSCAYHATEGHMKLLAYRYYWYRTFPSGWAQLSRSFSPDHPYLSSLQKVL